MTRINLPPVIKNVAITCDFFRAQHISNSFKNDQKKNLVWLQGILGLTNELSSFGVNFDVIVAPSDEDGFKQALANNEKYSEYIQNSSQAWASIYDTPSFGEFPALIDKLCTYDLVVGFELPPSLKRALHRAKKPYISFYIHPLRFLRDLCFLITTNSFDVAELLEKYAISNSESKSAVRKYSALFSRIELPALSFPRNLPVLIGQTECDSALIRDGKFLKWTDFESDISTALASYSEVILLEHPYRENSASISEYLRCVHGKTVISVRANSYSVIFSPIEPAFFMTLSSSLGVEAMAAGHECKFLYKNPCDKFRLENVDAEFEGVISHSICQDDFWKIIFNKNINKINQKIPLPELDFPYGDNYLRHSCLEFWAFQALQSGFNSTPVSKGILPASDISDEKLATLISSVCAPLGNFDEHQIDFGRKKTDWGFVDVLPRPLGISNDFSIDITKPESHHYLVEGFHTPENWGVWCSGCYARLLLPIQKNDGVVEISLGLRLFSVLINVAPIVHISANNQDVGIALFRKKHLESDFRFKFFVAASCSSIMLEFRTTHSCSPRDAGLSDDPRVLSFGISSLNARSINTKDYLDQGSNLSQCSANSLQFFDLSRSFKDGIYFQA